MVMEPEGVTTAEFTENDLTQNFTGSDDEGDASGGGEGGSGVNDSQATPTSATNANNTEVGGAAEGGGGAAEGGGGEAEGEAGGVTAAGGGGAEGGVVTGGENHTLTTEAGEAAVSEGNDDTTIPGGGGGTGGGGNDTDTVTTAPPAVPPANMTKVPVNCVCVTNWTNDPALPGTTHCPCPDLCAAHVVTCPAESTCYHLTCNLVTCSCPQHYKFDPFTASCQSPCQYFGDEVCGLGSGKKCKDSAEAERDYTCQCGSGYILANDTCQDVDECSGTGSSGVCGDTEQCVNVPGSHKCPCKQGYLRGSQGSCINVNECLNPSLHDCDHICVDTDPPAMYTCSCYTGYTWNDTQRRCVLNDISTGCECNDPERSLCYQPPGGEKQCSPRPGYKLQNSTFVDAAECVDKENVQAWCWKGGKCVEGEGGSRCECQDGYINVTLDYGRCTALECPAGTVVSGSQCV
ncbi:Signal peptide, CUB and EGF-like domain-containing protein 2-like, partial [Homarus americanus]